MPINYLPVSQAVHLAQTSLSSHLKMKNVAKKFFRVVPVHDPKALAFPLVQPTSADVDFVTTQCATLKKGYHKNLIGLGRRCRHGIPQSLLFSPVVTAESADGKDLGYSVNTGLTYLTCPRLVKRLDEIEGYADAGLVEYEQKLKASPLAQKQMRAVHENAGTLRKALVGAEIFDKVESFLETASSIPSDVMSNTGRCGITLSQAETTVKCLHYQLSDFLVRHPPPLPSTKPAEQEQEELEFVENDPNPVNAIGKMVYEDLVSSGYEVDGTEECWKSCSATNPCKGP
jgi:hypothetical protein